MSSGSVMSPSGGIGPEVDRPQSVTEDELFEVLSSRRRRYAIHYLLQSKQGGHAEIGDVAEHVAAWENQKSVRAITSNERKRAYTALQQTHFPKMDDLGVVKYEKNRGEIELTPAAKEVDIYLEVVRGNEQPWSSYYLALSMFGGVLMLALWFNAYPFGYLPDIAGGVFVTVSLMVFAAAHLYFGIHRKLGSHEGPPDIEP